MTVQRYTFYTYPPNIFLEKKICLITLIPVYLQYMMDRRELIRWTAIFLSFGIGCIYGYLSGYDNGYKVGKIAGKMYYQDKKQDSLIKVLVSKSK